MSNHNKRKGNAYENAHRKALESIGLQATRNTQYDQNQKGASDVCVASTGGLPALFGECKCTKSLPGKRILSALDQAKQARDEVGSGGIAYCVMHVHGTSRDVVALDFEDFARLLQCITDRQCSTGT